MSVAAYIGVFVLTGMSWVFLARGHHAPSDFERVVAFLSPVTALIFNAHQVQPYRGGAAMAPGSNFLTVYWAENTFLFVALGLMRVSFSV